MERDGRLLNGEAAGGYNTEQATIFSCLLGSTTDRQGGRQAVMQCIQGRFPSH